MQTIHETQTQSYLLKKAEFGFQRSHIQRVPDGSEWAWNGVHWEPLNGASNLPKVVVNKANTVD